MSKIPTHFSDEKNKGMILLAIAGFVSLILLLHLVQFSPIFAYLATVEFNAETWQAVRNFFAGYYNPQMFGRGMMYMWAQNPTYTVISTIAMVLLSLLPLIIALSMNPYRMYDLIHGDARRGTLRDIREMEDRKQVGIRGGNYLTLGEWPETKEPVRLIETLSVLVLAPPGTGKCLAPHEKVLMADGTVGINGDLRAGDKLMGPDGKPRTVLQANRGYGPMFRVVPKKGRSWECNGDHILVLRKSRHPFKGIEREVTVNEWLGWNDWQKSNWKLFKASMDFAEQSEPKIDPYFIGLLLGDGTTTAKVGIHTADAEIADHAYQVAARYGLNVREEYQENNASVFYCLTAGNVKGMPRKGKNPLKDQIADMGMNVSCGDKFIPNEYKMGSRRTRLEILAGIIDTDGYYDKKGKGYDLVSKSKTLIDDVTFIARSLGFSAYPKEVSKIATNTNAEGNYHRVFIGGDVSQIPVRLKRRKASFRMINKEPSNVGFHIEPIGEGEWHGIILDGDHKFLLDDFTVTHNTAAFVVPSILETDDSSFIVNDPKPELFDLTSGWRQEVGHVFKIDWSATDDTRDPDPEKWVFYPRFNVLSPKLLPPAGTAERDTYLDAIANVLSPSSTGGGKNDYFEQKGRAALVGFLHYLCSKIVDAGNFDGLPSRWKDAQEPCIPMIIDLINEGLRRAADENEAKKEEAAKNGGFHQGDALSDWLKAIVKECMDHNYNPRAATEITPLISMAPNERSGILGTMDKAFLPFKNAAVQERTTSCDFVPADLRGMIDPTDGEMKPVTLYMCVNQAEAQAFSTITSLVYEVLSREFLAYGPKETNKKGVTLGPYPVCFMLDEFAKLPKIESVMTGPDLGRSKKTYYCLVAQSDSQIGKIYSKEDQQIIYATTAVKFILPQNDEGTISLIQKMVGPTTIKRSNFSKSKGGDFKEWGKSNESTQLEKVDFIRAGDISAMKIGTHMLICQGFMSRPYTLKSKMFFKYPDLLSKAFNPRTGLGPKPAEPLPDFVRQRRIAEELARRQAKSAPSALYTNPYDSPVDLSKPSDSGQRAA